MFSIRLVIQFWIFFESGFAYIKVMIVYNEKEKEKTKMFIV